ncbi:acyl carrier protein [Streptomyces sp. NPDC088762]|uniref:acyl carrier protein n=1 Tax=Streptomyces sp. NPDC088762 TaxID=3365891 RepID=UPI003826E7F7
MTPTATLTAAHPVTALTEVILDVLVTKYEAPAGTTPDTNFERLGYDSLVLVEVAVDLSRRFGTEITDDELHQAGSVAEAARVLAARGVRA